MSNQPLSLFSTTTSSVMSVLQQAALDASAALAQKRFALVQTQLQNKYNQQVADLQKQNVPTATERFLQIQISNLGQRKSTFANIQTQYGNNVAVLGQLSQRITDLQNAASAGDSATFDGLLEGAAGDVSYLTVVNPNPVFQDDGVLSLKTNGLGVQSSSVYNLSTPAGQAAALADLTTLQQTVGNILSQTTINQTIAGTQANALDGQYQQLNNKLKSDQFTRSAQATTQILTLKTKLNTQIHLVELQFANTQTAAQSLEAQQNNLKAVLQAPAPGTILSIFA